MGSSLYLYEEDSDIEYAMIDLGSGDGWYLYVRPFLLVHYVSTQNQSLKSLLQRLLQSDRAFPMTCEEEDLLSSALPPGLLLAFMQSGRFYNYGPGELQSFWVEYLTKTREILETQSNLISDILEANTGDFIREIICDERMDFISEAIAKSPTNASATAG